MNRAGGLYPIAVGLDRLVPADNVLKRVIAQLGAVERHHVAEFALHKHLDRVSAVARGQYSVVGRGRASALSVTQDRGAALKARQMFELARYDLAYAAETDRVGAVLNDF